MEPTDTARKEDMMMKFKYLIILCILIIAGNVKAVDALESVKAGQWSVEKIQDWYDRQPWLVGCNYIPSTAVNVIEMWAEETYDPNTIDTELGWAQQIGFNTIRVFLHYLIWEQKPVGYKERISDFLKIADSHDISVMLVLFDDCWKPDPALGKQPDPIPGVHNSQWVQCPGPKLKEKEFRPQLEKYVKDIVGHFAGDDRVLLWDIYNEPRLENDLADEAVAWARSMRPRQPLTIGVAGWTLERQQAESAAAHWMEISDVVSFHNYRGMNVLQDKIRFCKKFGRPILCTEYMGTNRSNRFETVLKVFKEEKIGCYNWGLVAGKTQTYLFARSKEGDPEPKEWWCDLFRRDGSPHKQAEIDLIKRFAGKR